MLEEAARLKTRHFKKLAQLRRADAEKASLAAQVKAAQEKMFRDDNKQRVGTTLEVTWWSVRNEMHVLLDIAHCFSSRHQQLLSVFSLC